jgi:hypothetical protein
MAKEKSKILPWIIPEVAFFAFLYYAQYLLKVDANLWLSTLVLWILINIAIITCPVVKKCCK